MRALRPGNIRARRGATLVYVCAAMIAFLAIVSLAVDVGHARLVKNQLQNAADAAARFAGAGMQTGISTARSNAVIAAGNNTADGTPVVLDPNIDVEFGTWDRSARTFTVLSGAAQSGANAVRVTCRRTAARGNPVELTFGPAIGRSTCDVTAVAIALMGSGPPFGVVGLNGIRMSGSSTIDSFNSNNGPYLPGTATANASVGSNGNITLSGAATVRGDARPGAGMSTSGGTVTGSTAPLTSALSEPAASAGSYVTTNNDANVAAYMSGGGFSLSGSQSAVMPAGTYYFTSFNMSGQSTLTLLGPVTIYVAGTVSLSGGVTTSNSIPANLNIQVTTSASVTLSGATNYYVDLYAPQSRVSLTGGAQLMGSVVARFLTMSGGSSIHMDQSLSSGSGSGVSLVQ